jgi:hypothetical protein
MPLQAELLPAAAIFLRYLCHFDAAKVDLSGPDPNFNRAIKLLDLSNFGDKMERRGFFFPDFSHPGSVESAASLI